MGADLSFINEVENVIANGSADRRSQILERVTDLFILGSARFSEDDISIFDDVIGRLAARIEQSAQVLLANRLASIPNSPPNTVRTLAFNDAMPGGRSYSYSLIITGGNDDAPEDDRGICGKRADSQALFRSKVLLRPAWRSYRSILGGHHHVAPCHSHGACSVRARCRLRRYALRGGRARLSRPFDHADRALPAGRRRRPDRPPGRAKPVGGARPAGGRRKSRRRRRHDRHARHRPCDRQTVTRWESC